MSHGIWPRQTVQLAADSKVFLLPTDCSAGCRQEGLPTSHLHRLFRWLQTGRSSYSPLPQTVQLAADRKVFLLPTDCSAGCRQEGLPPPHRLFSWLQTGRSSSSPLPQTVQLAADRKVLLLPTPTDCSAGCRQEGLPPPHSHTLFSWLQTGRSSWSTLPHWHKRTDEVK